MSSTIVRRAGAVALVGAVAASLNLFGPTAHAETDPVPVSKATSWLEGRFHPDGLLHAAYDAGSGQPVDYTDYGGTIEAAYALDDLGRTGRLPAITSGLEGSVDSYITGADFGAADDHYAGPTGKLLAYVADLGGDADPTAFGGTNLVARMEALTGDSGQIEDDAQFPAPNVYGQIWATRGLLDVGSAEGPTALDFLLTQQCGNGHFLSFFSDVCGTTPAGPDATAFAIILLHDKATAGSALETALGKATDWLLSVQAKDGSFADDNGNANADSTGLAGWALRIEGRPGAAKRAAVWLRTLQVPGRSCDGKLASERGAIAYDVDAYKTGRSEAINQFSGGQWQTALLQSLPALQSAPTALRKLDVSAPRRIDAGDKVAVKVLGLAPGERGCVGIGAHTKPVLGARDGRAVSITIDVPKATGRTTVKVQSATDSAEDHTWVVR